MSTPIDDLLGAYRLPAPPPEVGPPSFTVIVRTQGTRPDSLNEALDSLADQTFTDFDVVIVVHGPPPTVAEVTTTVGARLREQRTITGTENAGRAAPLNVGLDHVSGTHFCFLDDDDLVTPDWLAAFARAAGREPATVVRAVTRSQAWITEDGQPARPAGDVELPFPTTFDLLAHMSVNLTPICSLAYPRRLLTRFALRFDEELPVYEDWEFLMRAAMVSGVTSIPEQTSLYRRLDRGNADTAESVQTWERAHAAVIDRLSSLPVLLPAGDARRLAGAHFTVGGVTRHETELAEAKLRIDQLTRSPARWIRAFGGRVSDAVRHRTSGRQP